MPAKSSQQAPSIAELASALAISTRRISQLKAAGLPTHSIEAAKVWRASQAKVSDSAELLRRQRLELLREQTRAAKLTADERENLLIPRGEVVEREVKIAMALQSFFRVLENEAPAALLGLSLEQSKPAFKRLLRAQQAYLADEKSDFWKTHIITPKP